MVSFIQSSAAVLAALLASSASTEAAYGNIYWGSRPSTALGSRTLPVRSGPSLFSRDIRRVIHDFDDVFGTMLGDLDDRFYEPLALQRMRRPSQLLEGTLIPNILAQSGAAKNALGIMQDDKQIQITVDAQGAKASDINLQLEEDDRRLTISGETKREEGGVSLHSRFERSFTLSRDIDTSQISAQMDNGVLTVTAPKYEEVRESIRRINIEENEKIESENVGKKEGGVDVSSSHEEDDSQKVKPKVDESVIDLDDAKQE
mmetsp:Transcript_26005/g.47152  ORF Transcript_26005/g.47152 Transcript_26005/m.47152 type:complete len:260 (-) Transcript_26005:85-864(-)